MFFAKRINGGYDGCKYFFTIAIITNYNIIDSAGNWVFILKCQIIKIVLVNNGKLNEFLNLTFWTFT